jgi:hypothetical protein
MLSPFLILQVDVSSMGMGILKCEWDVQPPWRRRVAIAEEAKSDLAICTNGSCNGVAGYSSTYQKLIKCSYLG